jgi:hypothetical protein
MTPEITARKTRAPARVLFPKSRLNRIRSIAQGLVEVAAEKPEALDAGEVAADAAAILKTLSAAKPDSTPVLLDALGDAQELVLQMGTIIRSNDDEGANTGFWTNDSDPKGEAGGLYVPDDRFHAIENALAAAGGIQGARSVPPRRLRIRNYESPREWEWPARTPKGQKIADDCDLSSFILGALLDADSNLNPEQRNALLGAQDVLSAIRGDA